jgi:cell division protein FtsI (penicillin-binding protein 3)
MKRRNRSIKSDIMLRLQLVFLGLALVGGAVVFRAVQIQTVHGERYRAKADSLQIRYQTIEADRGNIYSRHGYLLAASFPYFHVAVDPGCAGEDDFMANVDSLAWYLSRYAAKSHSEADWRRRLIDARRDGKRYLVLDAKVTYPELQRMRRWPLFRLGRYRGGLIAEPYNRRETPYGQLAHRTIGYKTNEVSVGIEGMHNEVLSGQNGKRLVRRIAGGHFLPLNDGYEIDPVDGRDVVTTLDVGIQDVAETALQERLEYHNAKYGSAIVMEVKTGAIVAIANLKRVAPGNYKEQYNFAVGDRTEPGSTFKLASVLALFEDGFDNLEEPVDLMQGHCRFYDRTMWDSERRHALNEVPMMRAFWRSSNVGISRLVHRRFGDRPEDFLDYLKQFHLHQATGIGILGEEPPIIPMDPSNRNEWSKVTLPWMSVGYNVQLSPLQVLAFYNAVANDGRYMKPYLVSEIREHGQTIERFEPVVVDKQIASPASIDMAQTLLRMVVDSGTARSLHNPHFPIAGKTGTAKIADGNRGYQDHVYQASFAGYFPADEPLYSCIVTVNAPEQMGIYGAAVAGPVFTAIADRVYASHLGGHEPVNLLASAGPTHYAGSRGYLADLRTIYQELDMPIDWSASATWADVDVRDTSVQSEWLELSERDLPDVRGMGLRDALYLLESKGWPVRFSGVGKVKAVRREGEALHLTLG